MGKSVMEGEGVADCANAGARLENTHSQARKAVVRGQLS